MSERQAEIIAAIKRRGGEVLTQELASDLKVTRAVINSALQRMSRVGLVRKRITFGMMRGLAGQMHNSKMVVWRLP